MKPTFILVAGAWHTAACFDPLIKALADAGYRSVAVTPRCFNSSPPATSFQPDADAVKEVLTELHGRDVVLVMHSYGGVVGTDAVGDLVANHPDVAAHIKRLVYLAAIVPLKGESLADTFLSAPSRHNGLYFDYYDGHLVLRDTAEEIFYHDVPEPERSRCAALLGKHSAGANTSPVSHAGFLHVPSTYIFTTLDRALGLEYQKFAVERVRSHVGERVAAGEALTRPFSGTLGEFSIETGHSAMVARPGELAAILRQIVEGM